MSRWTAMWFTMLTWWLFCVTVWLAMVANRVELTIEVVEERTSKLADLISRVERETK